MPLQKSRCPGASETHVHAHASELFVTQVVLRAGHVVVAPLHLGPLEVRDAHEVRGCDAVLLRRPSLEDGVLVGELDQSSACAEDRRKKIGAPRAPNGQQPARVTARAALSLRGTPCARGCAAVAADSTIVLATGQLVYSTLLVRPQQPRDLRGRGGRAAARPSGRASGPRPLRRA